MITWTHNISNRSIARDIHVLDVDRDMVRQLLEGGAIVSLTPNGEFAFASHTLERAIRCASPGDLIIWPDGRTFYCSDSRDD